MASNPGKAIAAGFAPMGTFLARQFRKHGQKTRNPAVANNFYGGLALPVIGGLYAVMRISILNR
jgi:hypothetical protein